ncbi:MAG: M42 family metallopeptidase [Clostridia bacterium]|nr:M42 family metallopeptidase [Clostridia bacterium]
MKKYNDIELLQDLSLLFGPTGCEDDVREFIKNEAKDLCDEIYTDRLGNLITKINGRGKSKIMISAHMDEVGFMVNEITDKGYLKFDTLGGIDTRVLCGKHVTIEANDGKKIKGLITSKAIHHKKRSERLDIVPITAMYIDIGVSSEEEAKKYVDIGSYGTFDSEFYRFGKDGCKIKSKALDDRLGCAVMLLAMAELYPIRDTLDADLYFCFTTREEIGLSGAQVAAQTIAPDFAIVLETTAVADIAKVPDERRVAKQGDGGAISLMDRSTIYDREFIEFALECANENGIKAQIKRYVSGGNDAAHIHKSGTGVRALALSAPTRYLHSPACVADINDYRSMYALVGAMLKNWKLEK